MDVGAAVEGADAGAAVEGADAGAAVESADAGAAVEGSRLPQTWLLLGERVADMLPAGTVAGSFL